MPDTANPATITIPLSDPKLQRTAATVEIIVQQGCWVIHRHLDPSPGRPHVLTHAPTGVGVASGRVADLRRLLPQLPQVALDAELRDVAALRTHTEALLAVIPAKLRGLH